MTVWPPAPGDETPEKEATRASTRYLALGAGRIVKLEHASARTSRNCKRSQGARERLATRAGSSSRSQASLRGERTATGCSSPLAAALANENPAAAEPSTPAS